MSLYFLINNFTFAFGMVGAIVCSMAAWLSFDAYRLRPDSFTLARSIGFIIIAISELIRALVLGSELLIYTSAILLVVGLVAVLFSFFKKNDLVVHAIVVIPAFTLWEKYFNIATTLLLFGIAYLALRAWKKEYNPTWVPFSLSFALVGLSFLLGTILPSFVSKNVGTLIELLIKVAGFSILGYWVWQYMRLRIKESIAMISIGVTFLLATIITLTFSTILIERVSGETARNLITDVKVLDLTISSLKEEALAKTTLVSQNQELSLSLSKNDSGTLIELAEKILNQYELGFLTVTDPLGNVLVRAHALSRRGDTLLGERSFEEALQGRSYVTIEDSVVEGLSIRSGSPIVVNGAIIGTVVAGYPLDNAFVDNMKRITGLEMFIYNDNTSVAGTAFSSDGATRLIGVSLDDTSVTNSVLLEGNVITSDVILKGEPFQTSYAPLSNSDGKIVGMLSAGKHEEDIIRIANATNRLTLVTVIIILVVLLAPIYILSRRVTEEAVS